LVTKNISIPNKQEGIAKKKIAAVIAAVTVLGLAGCQNAVSTNTPGTTATPAPVTDAQYFESEQTDDGEIRIAGLKDTSLEVVVIPDKIYGNPVVEIGEEAFKDCSSLTSIKIPDSVTEIGEGAFYGCSSLTSITIPDSVTEIGEGAFKYCSSLTIYGKSGSYAETYAKDEEIPFQVK